MSWDGVYLQYCNLTAWWVVNYFKSPTKAGGPFAPSYAVGVVVVLFRIYICRVFTITYLKQIMFLGYMTLHLLCGYRL